MVLIEDKASGQSLIQELERETRIPIKKIKVDKDKFSRFISITPLIEAGKILLQEGKKETEIFTAELEEFPNGEFDDIVDSTTQFINEYKGQERDFEFQTLNMKEIIKNHSKRIR